MGQFDRKVKPGTDSKPTVVEPQDGKPGYVVPSKLVDKNTGEDITSSSGDVNGGGALKRMSVQAGDTVRTLQGRLHTPRSRGGDVQTRTNYPTGEDGKIKYWKPRPDPTPNPKEVEKLPPTNQPYNLTTGAVKAQYNDPNSINSTTLSWDPKKGEAVETGVRHASQQFDKIEGKFKGRKGGTIHSLPDVREYEQKGEGRNPKGMAVTAQPTGTVYEKPSKVIGQTAITDTPKKYVEEDIDKLSDESYENRLRQAEHGDILSTTMREQDAGPEKVIGHVPVRSPGEVKKAVKPTVNKPGNVIPQRAIETFGNQKTDQAQAEAENKRVRENRSIPTSTTPLDLNKRTARPVRGKTPERQAVLGAKREERATALASEGKGMTTVAPEVMATAKGLGRTSHYGLDEDYMNSTGFLSHEAVQKATVAHALGVHHKLGTEDDKLHQYLGGRPLEAKSRLAAAYSIVDRKNRGNPEKVKGEFDLLHGMVHAGSSPQQTLRAVASGSKTDVVINGQTPTLPENSVESRSRGRRAASKATAPLGSIAATTTAPLAGSDRVAVRSIGQSPEEATIRDFSPQELRNRREKVPSKDDSKGIL
jgi:hypothetical protein